MSMKPEDTLNAQIWEILQDIKEEYLVTESSKPVQFRMPKVVGVGIIPPSRRISILKKLQEWEALKIVGHYPYGYLITIEDDKFEEQYEKYQKINTNPEELVVTPSHEYILTNADLAESLERILQNSKDFPEKEFFLGVGDYMKFIDENSGFQEITSTIDEFRERDRIQLKELEPKVLGDIDRVEKVVMKRIVDNHIEDEEVKRRVEEYEMTKDGRMQSSGTKTEALYRGLELVIMSVYESGHEELVSDLIKLMPESKSIMDYKVSEYFYSYREEVKELRNKVQKTIWGSWNELIVAYLVIHRYKEHMKELTDINDQIGQMNFYMLHQEMENVLGNRTDEPRRLQFIKNDYLVHVNRVHNFIVNKLKSDPYKNATHEVEQNFKEKYENILKELREMHEISSLELKRRYQKKLEEVKEMRKVKTTTLQVQVDTSKSRSLGSKLEYYPKQNIVSYEGETSKLFGQQARSLMTLLNENKGTPYSVEELQDKCNATIGKESMRFKKEKQIYDCIGNIRRRLKVEIGDYFPIHKQGENWIWLQK